MFVYYKLAWDNVLKKKKHFDNDNFDNFDNFYQQWNDEMLIMKAPVKSQNVSVHWKHISFVLQVKLILI